MNEVHIHPLLRSSRQLSIRSAMAITTSAHPTTASVLPPYSRNRLLPIIWADHDYDQQQLNVKLSALEETFRNFLGFVVEKRFCIPTDAPHAGQSLVNALQEFKSRCFNSRELLVVFYFGRATPYSNHQGVTWYARNPPTTARSLGWNHYQFNDLFPGEHDTLVILDAYYTENEQQRGSFGARKEILAASNTPGRNGRPDESSFTQRLINAICRFNQPFGLGDLIRAMASDKTRSPTRYSHHSRSTVTHGIFLTPRAGSLTTTNPSRALRATQSSMAPAAYSTEWGEQPLSFFTLGRVFQTNHALLFDRNRAAPASNYTAGVFLVVWINSSWCFAVKLPVVQGRPGLSNVDFDKLYKIPYNSKVKSFAIIEDLSMLGPAFFQFWQSYGQGPPDLNRTGAANTAVQAPLEEAPKGTTQKLITECEEESEEEEDGDHDESESDEVDEELDAITARLEKIRIANRQKRVLAAQRQRAAKSTAKAS